MSGCFARPANDFLREYVVYRTLSGWLESTISGASPTDTSCNLIAPLGRCEAMQTWGETEESPNVRTFHSQGDLGRACRTLPQLRAADRWCIRQRAATAGPPNEITVGGAE
jgi:hypothetical protein